MPDFHFYVIADGAGDVLKRGRRRSGFDPKGATFFTPKKIRESPTGFPSGQSGMDVIYRRYLLNGNTLKTRILCQEATRPHFVISQDEAGVAEKTREWLGRFFSVAHPVPLVLNVVGPREGKAMEIRM